MSTKCEKLMFSVTLLTCWNQELQTTCIFIYLLNFFDLSSFLTKAQLSQPRSAQPSPDLTSLASPASARPAQRSPAQPAQPAQPRPASLAQLAKPANPASQPSPASKASPSPASPAQPAQPGQPARPTRPTQASPARTDQGAPLPQRKPATSQ